MPLAHVALLAIAANAFSGVAALVHFKPIIPGMASAGVPESWLTFPIGTLKTAGAVGLLLGAQASMSAATGARNDTEPSTAPMSASAHMTSTTDSSMRRGKLDRMIEL